jgi:hypothetical protein
MKLKYMVLGVVVAVILVGCVGPLVVGIFSETPLKFEDVSREEEFASYIGRRYVLTTNMLLYGVCLPPGYRDTIDQYFMTPDTPGPTGREVLSKERLEAGSSMEILGVQRSGRGIPGTSPTVEASFNLPNHPKATNVPVTVNWSYILCPEYWTEDEMVAPRVPLAQP